MIPDNIDALLRRRPTAEALTEAGYPVRATRWRRWRREAAVRPTVSSVVYRSTDGAMPLNGRSRASASLAAARPNRIRVSREMRTPLR
jgi:hypothetical protein